MSETISETRLEWALRRGYVREGATTAEVQRGLEDMHEAPLTQLGPFAVAKAAEDLTEAMQASTTSITA